MRLFALLIPFCLCLSSGAERGSSPGTFDVKERVSDRKPSPKKAPRKEPERFEPQQNLQDEADSADVVRMSTLITTPLLATNNFDRRFESFGSDLTLSFPVGRAGSTRFFLETGVGFMFSHIIALSTFNHVYFHSPVRLRMAIAFGSWGLEFMGGAQFKLLELSTQSGTAGGFGFVSNFFGEITPDFAIGLGIGLGKGTILRITVGYVHLAAGLDFRI